jgi:DNA replication initiation complex subunit (GINS family)
MTSQIDELEGYFMRATNREKISKASSLSQLDADFYERLVAYFELLPLEKRQVKESMLRDMMTQRTYKIASMACMSKMTEGTEGKLSKEEKELFHGIHNLVADFQKKIHDRIKEPDAP